MSANLDLLKARTHSIAIEITSRCNLRCTYCHKADDVLEAIPAANADMTEETIGDLYLYCKKAGVQNVTLSVGGETTFVAGWHRLIAPFLDDAEIHTHMVSNFVRPLDDEELEAFTKLNALQISFDSADLAMVRKLRSKADLRTIAYNIIRLRQAGRKFGRCPFLLVNCTICRDNIGHIAGLAGFCRELGVDQLLLCEVMPITEQTPPKSQLLDTLTDDDVILLAKQIIAAEEILRDSATGLRLREHLQDRIGELIEQLREGVTPTAARAHFNRQMVTSACFMPWQAPQVGATGKVVPCCGSLALGEIGLGDLSKQTMAEIMDGDVARQVRASILDGRPIVACSTCSLAQPISFPEFVRQVRETFGDTSLPPRESDVQSVAWPGLLGSSSYPVLIENSALTVGGRGDATLTEQKLDGFHRVLIGVKDAKYSAIRFRVRSAGRRRMRLDLYRPKDKSIVGRADLLFRTPPQVVVRHGGMECVVTRSTDRWYDVQAVLSSPQPVGEIDLFLMREDEAVSYRGDGRSGLEISGLSVV